MCIKKRIKNNQLTRTKLTPVGVFLHYLVHVFHMESLTECQILLEHSHRRRQRQPGGPLQAILS